MTPATSVLTFAFRSRTRVSTSFTRRLYVKTLSRHPLNSGLAGKITWTRGRNSVRVLSWMGDRKSTRLNSSHVRISYAVFCLKKQRNLLFHLVLSLCATEDSIVF